LGDFNGTVYGGYLLSLLICYFCIFKGVTFSGRIAVYSASFPYVLLVIMILRGFFLPGAIDGLIYAFTPDFSKIFEIQIWSDAAI